MNDWLDYKGSGSSRAYMGDTISHAARTMLDKAREYASTRSSVKSAYDELLKLDSEITALGNEIKTADKSRRKTLKTAAMSKYSLWKTKYAAFKTLLNKYKQLKPADTNMTNYNLYVRDSDYEGVPGNISDAAYKALFENE